jgi:hypothetical protein
MATQTMPVISTAAAALPSQILSQGRCTRSSDLAVDRQEDLEDTDQEDRQADPLEDPLAVDRQEDQDPFSGTQAPEVEGVAEAS